MKILIAFILLVMFQPQPLKTPQHCITDSRTAVAIIKSARYDKLQLLYAGHSRLKKKNSTAAQLESEFKSLETFLKTRSFQDIKFKTTVQPPDEYYTGSCIVVASIDSNDIYTALYSGNEQVFFELENVINNTSKKHAMPSSKK